MKKILSLFALLMTIVIGAKAGTESSGNQGSSNQAIIGTSYTLSGDFVAGKGGVQQGNMPDKGVKMRSNKGDLVFTVNDGYKITSFKFYGAGNTTTPVTITSATVDGGSNLLSSDVVLPAKGASTSGDIILTDIAAQDNITFAFASGTSAQYVGTWEVVYEQTEVITQEVTGVTLNGSAISDTDLATLKSTKALTIDGSSLNGLGTLDVTLSSGATNVSRAISDGNAVYTFSINGGADAYTVTVTNVAKSYTAQGSMIYYSKGGTNVEGANTKTITANGITAEMVADKTFQYGSGSATIGGNVYVPLKLSTGSGVNVTFPAGKKATKVIVYGWSANGDGAINSINESETADKAIDTSADIFYATNESSSNYPSVYEYTLDNWESFYFNPGGSASQPFVVMDFVFAGDTPVATAPTITTQPQNVEYTIGSETYPTMTVEAEASAGELTYAWEYSVDGETFNAIPSAKVPSAATATLSGEEALAALGAVSAATYYVQCKVSDDNGSTYSNVVTLTVKEAAESTAKTLPYSEDFTTWAGTTWSQGNTTTPDVIKGITFYSKNSSKQFSASANGLTFPENNIGNSNYFMAIPLTGVQGTIKVTLVPADGNDDKKAAVNYVLKDGDTEVGTPGSTGTTATAAENGGNVVFFVNCANDDAVLYLGRKNSDAQNKTFKSISIEAAQSQTVTVGETGFATVGLPFAAEIPTGVTAYAVTAVSNGKVTTSEAIAAGTTVPANQGFIIVAAKADYTFTEAASATYTGTSLLQAASANGVTATATAPIFVLAKISDTKVGFRKSINGTLGAYKAYLPGTNVSGESLEIDFGGAATAINGIAEADAEAAPAKVVKNGKLYIGNYNVAGQLVK